MIKSNGEGRWLIVRFWPSGQQLQPGAIPIWLGSVAFLEERNFLGILKFSEEATNGAEALEILSEELRPLRQLVLRVNESGQTVVLLPP